MNKIIECISIIRMHYYVIQWEIGIVINVRPITVFFFK